MKLKNSDIFFKKNTKPEKSDMWNKIFPYVIILIFLILSIILILKHEFWRDEMTGWLVGADSSSLNDFVNKMRDNQGHPFLWSFIMYLTSHFITRNVEIMKLIHLLISSTTAFLILKYSPFNKIIKILIIFSYFLFYEYSIISRNYAIGILCAIIFCCLYKNKEKNLISISITLFFMGQGSIYSFLISIVFFFFLYMNIFLEKNSLKNKLKKRDIIISIFIFILSVAVIFWQLGPLALDENVFSQSIFGIFNKSNLEYLNSPYSIFTGIIKVFLNIPKFFINFWESNLITDALSNVMYVAYSFILSFLLFLIPFFVLKRKVLFLYVLGFISIVFVPFFIYKGYLRHFGHLFVFLFCCLWISEFYEKNKYIINFEKKNLNKIIYNIFITTILILSLYASVTAFYYDYNYYFSKGKKVAQVIAQVNKENFDLKNFIIIGYHDTQAELVSGFLDKDFYYPQSLKSNKFGKLISWNERRGEKDINYVLSDVFSFVAEGNKVLLVITNPSNSDLKKYKKIGLREKYGNEDPSIKLDDDYYLFYFDEVTAVSHFVNNVYLEFLNRYPTEKELNKWVHLLNLRDKSSKVFIKEVVKSEEFVDRKITNSKFVEILYKSLLQREPDKKGFEGWVKFLENKSELNLIEEFTKSQEFRDICNKYNIIP